MKQPTIALIDIDQIIYAVAAMADKEEEPDNYILHSANRMLKSRIAEVVELYPTVNKINLFISDVNNFRKKIAKEKKYKGNRKQKPMTYKLIRDHMIRKGAISRPWLEADDVTAMVHNKSHLNGTYETVLVDQDKDLNQIQGHRVIPSRKVGGEIVREATARFITEEEALLSFYTQLLTGDTSDNIKGLRGVGEKKASAILEGVVGEYNLYSKCLETYSDMYRRLTPADVFSIIMERGNLLYMKRIPHDVWIPPRDPEGGTYYVDEDT